MRIAPISDARALRRLRTDPDAICVLYDRHVAHLVADLARVSRDREIRTVRFEGFLGEVIERRVGEGGFFVAGAEARICPDEDWTSTFTGVDTDGNEVARASITLVDVQISKGSGVPVCGFGVGPHGRYDG